MRCLGACILALVLTLTPGVAVAYADTEPQFKLGFRALVDQIPDVVGAPLEDESFDPITGDSEQHTANGLLVWRKADNWIGYTDGSTTWVVGPDGVHARPNSARFPWEADDRFDAPVEEAALGMINTSRAECGLAPLSMDPVLRRAARDKSLEMGTRNYFAHVSPEGVGPLDRMRAAGARFGFAGENIGTGTGYATSLDTVLADHEAMMAEASPSDSHRANILDPRFRRVGIGVYRTPSGKTYYTSDFAD